MLENCVNASEAQLQDVSRGSSMCNAHVGIRGVDMAFALDGSYFEFGVRSNIAGASVRQRFLCLLALDIPYHCSAKVVRLPFSCACLSASQSRLAAFAA